MKAKFSLVALALIFVGAVTANAQLTTGEPTAKVIRTGNRAAAGDFGLYVGATSDMFKNLVNSGTSITALPLLNLKYMTSDNFELRVGLEAYKLSEQVNGSISSKNSDTASKNKFGNSTLMIYPGFAYHFSKLNLLDVYVGVELPLGWDAYTSKNEVSGAYSASQKITKRSFVLGLGAFVGLQAYIADLPLAIGVEYGLSSRLDTGLKYKNVTVSDNTTTTTYVQDPSKFSHLVDDATYSKLAARKGEIGGQFRLTLSYYFK